MQKLRDVLDSAESNSTVQEYFVYTVGKDAVLQNCPDPCFIVSGSLGFENIDPGFSYLKKKKSSWLYGVKLIFSHDL